MKKQNKLNIQIRDLEPLKDVWAGRHRKLHARARAFGDLDLHLRGDRRVRGAIGFTSPQ